MAKPEPKLPELFYELKTGAYWMRINVDRFLPVSSGDLKDHLKLHGHDSNLKDDLGLSFGERFLTKTREDRYVDFAGPLAGHRAGYVLSPGEKRVLVTQSFRLPLPGDKPKCPIFEKFFDQLLGNEQTEFLLAWLKIAYGSLERGDFQPGQCLVLAGPANCGKSFLQQFLITQILGGRSARPYRYMTGGTQFNEDLAGAEHHWIGDEVPNMNIAARRAFGEQIKDFTVNEEMSLHGKNKTALTVSTYRRLSVSVNDQAESLMIMPPMNDSLMDKIALLKCSVAKCLTSDRFENRRVFLKELPGFIAFLKQFRIRPSLARYANGDSCRCGVREVHQQELLEILNDTSPEHRLDGLIDQVLPFEDKAGVYAPWQGTAEDLEAALRSSKFAFSADKIFNFSSAAGTYLARLRQKSPDRYVSRRLNGRTIWTINQQQGEHSTNGK